MDKKLFCFIVFIVLFVTTGYSAEDDIVLGVKAIPKPLAKKPISVRASEARQKKVYDFKQHYMKPESTNGGK